MTDERYLFQLISGMGNQAEKIPAYVYLAHKHKNVDAVYVTTSSADEPQKQRFFSLVCEMYGNKLITIREGNCIGREQGYSGIFSCRKIRFRTDIRKVVCTDSQHVGNEVELNNRIIDPADREMVMRDMYPLAELRGQLSGWCKEKYELVISNGGYNTPKWARKRYQRWHEVAAYFIKQGVKVACIGRQDEFVPGCVHVGVEMDDALAIVASCKVLAANNTGFYHIRNALGGRVVAVFTAMNKVKDCNDTPNGFHRFTRAIVPSDSCPNHPCMKGWAMGPMWDKCTDWKCAEFEPTVIIKAIEKELE